LNRSPTFVVQNMTPKEAWSGRKPYVNHFKKFGCIAFAHVPDQKRKKPDDKAKKYVFIGVSETSKAYKLFNPSTKKIVTSKDVVFDEENTWDWNRQQPTQVFLDENDEKGQTSASGTSQRITPTIGSNFNKTFKKYQIQETIALKKVFLYTKNRYFKTQNKYFFIQVQYKLQLLMYFIHY